jgi:hypothetical protein
VSANLKGQRLQGERSDDRSTVGTLRGWLLTIFVLGAVGTGVELLLLGHTEGAWQWGPIVLLALSLVVLGWRPVGRGATGLRLFQGTMAMFVLSSGFGLWFHYQVNREFELEMYPSLQGLDLFSESITGATPTLAPGVMLQLGLLGLAYTYRHPDFGPKAVAASPGDSNHHDHDEDEDHDDNDENNEDA